LPRFSPHAKDALGNIFMASATTKPATIVTGASSGIGRALTLEAMRDSAAVVLVARSREALEALAAEIGEAGCEAHVLTLDVTLPDAPETLATFLDGHGLHCEVLVNNAGMGLVGPAVRLDPGRQLAIVDLNIRALTALSLRFLPDMMGRRSGGILHVGSVAGFLPGPGMAVYYASKAYVRSLSEALWEEARRARVTISCLAPGPVDTAFLDKAGARSTALFGGGMNISVETCASEGWRGFRQGKRMIVPGFRNKATVVLMRFVPTRLVLWAVRRLQKARAGRD
jgi:uncharacterized protein